MSILNDTDKCIEDFYDNIEKDDVTLSKLPHNKIKAFMRLLMIFKTTNNPLEGTKVAKDKAAQEIIDNTPDEYQNYIKELIDNISKICPEHYV